VLLDIALDYMLCVNSTFAELRQQLFVAKVLPAFGGSQVPRASAAWQVVLLKVGLVACSYMLASAVL
jgi:hypothetical protein